MKFLAAALLTAATALAEPALTRGPYLQNATPSSLVVRWRTAAAATGVVRFGTSPAALTQSASGTPATDHAITLTGLTPGTRYYYTVGTTAENLTSAADFKTPPLTAGGGPVRIWAIGDSGSANADAAAVRDSFVAFNGTKHTDVWLMLGDNAYASGTDAQYQAAVFDMYPLQLRRTLLWSTLGNHDAATLGGAPYFDIFTLPAAGEAGGAASGSERYYSFNYGGIHFVCLDSMSTSRSATGAMAAWLQADLAAATSDWIIAFWHHPPYTKGSHDSDNETELIEMRQNLVPILEAGGVDLVLTGHSHAYERSKFINSHHGGSWTLTGAMVLDSGSGSPASGGYTKPGDGAPNEGAVYVVAGSSGKLGPWTGGSTALVNPNPHPVMFKSLRRLGSLALEIHGGRLDAKFIRPTTAAPGYVVEDSFRIVKSVANFPPEAAVASPVASDEFVVGSPIVITPAASDLDGTVELVDFYANGTLIATDISAPFSATWTGAALGNHALTVKATDNGGATTTSDEVVISVVTEPDPAGTPVITLAQPGVHTVALTWSAAPNATSYTIQRSVTPGGPYTTVASRVRTTTFTDHSLSGSGPFYYVVAGVNALGTGANSNEVTALPALSTEIAETGGQVSGAAPGTVWNDVGIPAINDAGHIAMLAALTDATGTFKAIVAGAPPAVVARTGGATPGMASTFSSFTEPMLNEAGRVAFYGKAASNPASDEGLWADFGSGLALAARENGDAADIPGAKWLRFHSSVFGDSALAFFATLATGPGGVTSLNNTGIWLADATGARLALREGQAVALAAGTKTVKTIAALTAGSSVAGHGYHGAFASVLARVTLSDGTHALLELDGTGVTEIAASGGPAPGYAPGAQFGTFGHPSFAPDGLAFSGTQRNATGDVSGINSAAIFSGAPGSLFRAAVRGGAAPGTGVAFAGFSDAAGAEGGKVAFVSSLAGAGITAANNSGIFWRDDSGQLRLAAREGHTAPGGGAFDSFTATGLPGGPGGPFFTARLALGGTVTTANRIGFWATASDGTLRELVRAGSPLVGKTVSSFKVLGSIARSPAQRRAFNDTGKTAVYVRFTDGSRSVVVFDVP